MPSRAPSPAPGSARRPRGATVSALEVRAAADALLRAGERPSVEAVRRQLGDRGSPNRLAPLLAEWYRDLGARLAKGPSAFERVPAPAAQLLEALWLSLADEARRQAADPTLSAERARLDLRAHVLSQRESELHARLKDRDALAAALEGRATDLDKQLARAVAELSACRTRLAEVSADRNRLLQRLAAPRPRAPRPPVTPAPRAPGTRRQATTASKAPSTNAARVKARRAPKTRSRPGAAGAKAARRSR
jgi:hypothetical protein